MLSNLKCTRQCLKVTSQSVSLHRSAHHTPHHKKTHYEVLKVPKTASSDQIRTAYIKRCKELHPDRNIGDPQNHNKMVRLNEAYQCLSKKSSKADYDRKLNMGINITESYYPSSQQRPYEPPRPDSSSYQQWQQTYYGASREESSNLDAATVARVVALVALIFSTITMIRQRIRRFRGQEIAQRERDYYRRIQMEFEKEWNSRPKKTMNEAIFNSFLVVFTVFAATLAYAYINSQAHAERLYWQQQQKQEKKNEGVRFSNSLILPFIFGLSAFFSGAILQHNKDRQIRPKRHAFRQDYENAKFKEEKTERLDSFRMVNMYFRGAFLILVIVAMTGNIIRSWSKTERRKPGTLFGIYCAVYIITASTGIIINIAKKKYKQWAERSMAQRELNRSKGIYFNEGNYPRPYRRNGRQSQSSDHMEEKEIGS